MKTLKVTVFAMLWATLFLVQAIVAPRSLASSTTPIISSIRLEKAEIVVVAQVSAGVTKVTLEARTRLGAGTWIPRAVARVDGTGGEVTFRLKASEQLEVLRVRGDAGEPLPAAFYKGTNSFAGPASAGGPQAAPPTVPGAVNDANRNAPTETAPRSVVESDIWKIRQNTLYFFNQYRGLQVIDLTAPDAPVIRGTLDLPAAGEQMYLLESGPVVLLAHDGCTWGTDDYSDVLVVDVTLGTPTVVASLPVSGSIQESRMVGTALYVVSQTYRPVNDSKEGAWEWGSLVSSFDLSNPGNPVVKDALWNPGYGNVVTATDRFLFVVTQDPVNWWRSVVQCIDISSPDGAMKATASIKTDGRVPDKFKINLDEETLTIISENWNTNGRGVFTLLETFSLKDPTAPAKLGELELAKGEQLHATRFDGKRVYVVTFFRVDPLWVIDLSDPANPHVAGELQVPGWSTFIQPLGDQLVSIGIADSNSWRVAVSLFDVKDPTHPALLDKVPLGENYSWSEATYDEKAFSVLPEAGLILVPYQGSFSEGGYASRVQLIDLNATTLKARGYIEHEFQPRRATLQGDRILSIAGNELLVVDASNRDQPVVKATSELAWPVSKVFLQGPHLIEVSSTSGWLWSSQPTGTIRIAAADNPNKLLNLLTLSADSPIVGTALKENRLYVLQGKAAEIIWPPWDPNSKDQPPPTTNAGKLVLNVFDVSQLPTATLLGHAEAATTDFFGSSLDALWVGPGLVVWEGGGSYLVPWLGGPIAARPAAGIVTDVGIWRPWWGGGGSGLFFAFDVSNAAAPSFVSEVNLTSSGTWWSFGSAFTSAGLVYLSHQSSEFVEGVQEGNPAPPAPPTATPGSKTDEPVKVDPPIGMWVTRYYLDVIDYADPKAPTTRKPVNIPGTLRGLSHNGAVLYTTGAHWDAKGNTDWTEWLDASAYDGVSASLITSLPLKDWPHPLLIQNGNIFVGRASTSSGDPAQLEVLKLGDDAKLAQVSSTALDSNANDLALFGDLLAVQQDRKVTLLDASNPATLVVRGGGQTKGCLWYDLRNADGTLDRGLILPLNEYGVAVLPVKPAPPQ